MKLRWVVCGGLLIWESAISVSNEVGISNDNFCDLANGSDENATSACSHISMRFYCLKSDGLTESIPSSRYNDGVCDCCDGSDEVGSLFNSSCSDRCGQGLLARKQESLIWYRTVQAGVRARHELTDIFKRAKFNEQKQYNQLLEDRIELNTLFFTLRYFLTLESPLEEELRLKLIREREAHCASGNDEACDYFHSTFLDDDELVHEGFPLEYANPKARLKFQHTDEEKAYMESKVGVDRVKASLCVDKNILPDQDSRIFSTLGEYLAFTAATATNHAQHKTAPSGHAAPPGPGAGGLAPGPGRSLRDIRRSTLFGPFLEDGAKGHLLAALSLGEVLGVLLAPVILPLQALGDFSGRQNNATWQYIVNSAKLASPVAVQRTDRDSAAWPNTAPALVSNLNDKGSGDSAELVTRVCRLLLSMSEEDSAWQNMWSALDPTQYSGVLALLQVLHPLTVTPTWLSRVIWHTPQWYVDYYLFNKGALLPPSRRACLIRAGLAAAQHELHKLDNKIAEETELRGLLATSSGRVSEDLTGHGSSDSSGVNDDDEDEKDRQRRKKSTRKPRKSSSSSSSSAATAAVSVSASGAVIDFGGEDGAWEAVKDVCVDKIVRSYNYKFCFFKDVKQGAVILGKYDSWGPRDMFEWGDDHDDSDGKAAGGKSKGGKTSAVTTASKKKKGAVRSVSAAYQQWAIEHAVVRPGPETSHTAGNKPTGAASVNNYNINSSTSESITGGLKWLFGDSSVTEYSKVLSILKAQHPDYYAHQQYENGALCQGKPGQRRRATVVFRCAAANEITEVTEVEICVYELQVNTPMACTAQIQAAALESLDALGVFGFSKSTGNAPARTVDMTVEGLSQG